MKSIEDIEKMNPEELESAALKEDIKIPASLERDIKSLLVAQDVTEKSEGKNAASESPQDNKKAKWIPLSAIALAACLAVVAIIRFNHESAPKDTFDDPYLAYAEVEATFKKISDKMSIGLEMTFKVGETAEKPLEVINKIKE